MKDQQQSQMLQEQQLQENAAMNEQLFEAQKKEALQAMQKAQTTILQIGAANSSLQSLQQASQQLQQASQQLSQIQGLAITQATTAKQQQLEQVQQQIEQASQTLGLIQSLNDANCSFKKG